MQWPPTPGPGRELHEAVGLGGRRLDHLPHVDAQLVAHDRHLVDQGDIDRPEGVLQQLDHLGRLGGRDRHDGARWPGRRAPRPPRGTLASHRRRLSACFPPPNPCCPDQSARARKPGKSQCRPQSVQHSTVPSRMLGQHRQQQFFGRAGIGGRFQHHQHARDEYTGRQIRRRRSESAHRGRGSCSTASARKRWPRRIPQAPSSQSWRETAGWQRHQPSGGDVNHIGNALV